MMRLVIVLAAALLAINISPSNLCAAETSDKEVVAAGNNEFALELYKRLKEENGNLFFSPIGISTAFAIAQIGARGKTATQVTGVLQFKLSGESLHKAFSEIMKNLNSDPDIAGYEVSLANRLWGQYGYEYKDEFIAEAEKYYGAAFKKADFTKERSAARKRINKWAEKNTNGRIVEFIGEGALRPLTRLLITNAVYFKGKWMFKFDENRTGKSEFTLLSGEKISVPIMNQTADFEYLENEDLKALRLLYVGGELSMIVLLPKKKGGIQELEGLFNLDNLKLWLGALQKKEVSVSMPKFKMETDFFLKNVLSEMGMPDAFAYGRADFSGITGDRSLYIGDVIHKAHVDVNEEGTEAAAAIGIEIKKTSVAETETFDANRPFIFIIHDTRASNILFLGRMVDPRTAPDLKERSKYKVIWRRD